jgi:hypothetical protein
MIIGVLRRYEKAESQYGPSSEEEARAELYVDGGVAQV